MAIGFTHDFAAPLLLPVESKFAARTPVRTHPFRNIFLTTERPIGDDISID
jgi:hypothetical protein